MTAWVPYQGATTRLARIADTLRAQEALKPMRCLLSHGRQARQFVGQAEVVPLACAAESGTVHDIAFTADGREEVLGCKFNVLREHSAKVSAVAFSPDGRLLATGSLDDLVTGRERATLQGHTHRVRSVAYSPDGLILASAGSDQTVRLWDLATSRQDAILRGHSDSIRTVVFAPDGTTLASAAVHHEIAHADTRRQIDEPLLEAHQRGHPHGRPSPRPPGVISCRA